MHCFFWLYLTINHRSSFLIPMTSMDDLPPCQGIQHSDLWNNAHCCWILPPSSLIHMTGMDDWEYNTVLYGTMHTAVEFYTFLHHPYDGYGWLGVQHSGLWNNAHCCWILPPSSLIAISHSLWQVWIPAREYNTVVYGTMHTAVAFYHLPSPSS